MDEEGFDDAMEDGVVVETLETELHEVPHGFGGFLGPELDVDGSVSRLQQHLPLRRGLQYIDRRHLIDRKIEIGRD